MVNVHKIHIASLFVQEQQDINETSGTKSGSDFQQETFRGMA